MFKAYLEDISGATAIEYGLIAALIGIAVIGSSLAATDSINDLFNGISDELS